eukprot:s5260_g3.t2
MAHDRRPCTWRVKAKLDAWMCMPPTVQNLFLSQLAQQIAEQLDCERGNCQLPIFEANVPLFAMPRPIFERDLLPVAFTEEDSDTGKNRRDSWVTRVSQEGHECEQFEEREEFDDGVGGVAQAPAQQRLLMTDSKDDSEAVKPQTFDIGSNSDGESEAAKPQMFDISSDVDDESEAAKPQMFDISNDSDDEFEVRKPFVWIGGFPFDPEDFDTGWEYLYDGLVCPQAEMRALQESTDCVAKAEISTEVQEVRRQSLEATLHPEIFLQVLGFLPVNEVLEYNLQAVSHNFSSREVWMTHLINFADVDSFQPIKVVPTAPVWHPMEELTAFVRIATMIHQSQSLSPWKAFFSTNDQIRSG